MKRIIPEIYVDNCKEALEYYQKAFGGEIKNVQMSDGKEMFKGLEGKIIHSELHINDDCVMYLVDLFEGKKETGDVHLLLELDNEEEINKIVAHFKLLPIRDAFIQGDLNKIADLPFREKIVRLKGMANKFLKELEDRISMCSYQIYQYQKSRTSSFQYKIQG